METILAIVLGYVFPFVMAWLYVRYEYTHDFCGLYPDVSDLFMIICPIFNIALAVGFTFILIGNLFRKIDFNKLNTNGHSVYEKVIKRIFLLK